MSTGWCFIVASRGAGEFRRGGGGGGEGTPYFMPDSPSTECYGFESRPDHLPGSLNNWKDHVGF